MGRPQGAYQGGGDLATERVGDAGDDDGVGAGQVVEAVVRGEGEPADGSEGGAGLLGADLQAVPGGGQQPADLGSGQGEHLDHHAEFERCHAVEGVHGHVVDGLRPASDGDGHRPEGGRVRAGEGGGRSGGGLLIGHGLPSVVLLAQCRRV